MTGPEAAIVLSLLPPLQQLALAHRAACDAQGVPFTFVSGFRSTGYQRLLYEHPDLHPGTPAAKPGTSKHELAAAYDVETAGMNDLQKLVFGQEAERLGLVWGGRFTTVVEGQTVKTPDWGHCELAASFAALEGYALVAVSHA
jgi:D-alanyl-D-alanine carboxypeptidase